MRYVAGLLTLPAIAAFTAPPATAPITSIQTESGRIEGSLQNGVLVYQGIPFAAPPVGDLRWRAPQPVVAWTGIRMATRSQPACMQSGSYPPDAPPEPSSEDCLYLNIWKPVAQTAGRLPVMVWIYGGGLQNGSAAIPLYAGDMLARRGVMVVTANYRLGVFGFLADPELTQESPHQGSGNYGLLDQIAALSWVHRNIAAFGGDPDRVTVFGQSSGSISISALVASPLAKGLFQRAIGESGGLFEPLALDPAFSLAGAEKQGQSFVAHAGAASISALRAEPAAELMKIPFGGNIIVDGHVLTQSPYEAYSKGQQNDVDVLVGSNADEGQWFLTGRTITPESLTRELGRDFPPLLVWLLGPEPMTTNPQARAAAAAFEGDLRFRWDMWTWARLAATHGKGKVFLYEFTRVPPYPAGSHYAGLGATHGLEMPYVFDHLDQQPLPWTTADRSLATVMSAYWTNFAKFGDPNGSGLPVWPAFRTEDSQIIYLGAEIEQGAIRDSEALYRIDRVYSSARYVQRNFYVLIAAAVLVVGSLVTAMVRGFRRRHRPRPA